MQKFRFLLRNVSFRAIIPITFSFRYNSSSLRFGLIPWQFQNKMFKPMKVVKGYLSWMTVRYSGLLGDLGLELDLGTALVELLGGEVDFKVMDSYEVVLVDEFTLVLVNVKGLGGQGR